MDRGQALSMLLGKAGRARAENGSSAVSWSWRPGWGSGSSGAGGGQQGPGHTPCLYLHPGQLVPGGRETQVGLPEIPEKKENPQHLKTKGPLAWVGSPCPTAWRSEQSDGTEDLSSQEGEVAVFNTQRERSGKPSP